MKYVIGPYSKSCPGHLYPLILLWLKICWLSCLIVSLSRACDNSMLCVAEVLQNNQEGRFSQK